MDPPKPFPILRLPFLAIEHVFKTMDPFEIINFSMTSKRSKAVTKKMTLYSKYHIFVTINNALEITIRGINNFVTCTYEMTSDKQMDGKTEEMTYKDRIFRNVYNYAEDLVEGWKQLCKHVLDIFKRKTIDGIGMTMDEFVDHNVSVIDFLKTNEIVVNGCYLYQNRRKKNVDKHVAYFLKNLTVNLNFTLHLNIRNNNFDGKIPKRLHLLNIEPSKWIGYERLLKIDSKHVILRNNRITNEQWNLFLKKWVSMETNQNLEYMELDKRELGGFRDRVLYDIPHEVVSEEVSRILTIRYKQTQEIRGGIDIRRTDGKTATFFVLRASWGEYFSMCIH